MQARALMIQGTGSDVGKSLLVAGFARVFVRRGLRVRPFKPQNMSNNAAVTADGGEIGRAQALQARAARAAVSVHMNPVLLKPQSDVGAQLVVQGRVVGNTRARDYQAIKAGLLGAVLDSFGRLPHPRSTFAPTTSPTRASPGPRTCRSSWWATSTAAASSPAWLEPRP